MSEDALTMCPACEKPALVRQVSAVGFALKGSGWYVTDFRDKGKSKKSEGDSASTGSEGAAASSDSASTPAPAPAAADGGTKATASSD